MTCLQTGGSWTLRQDADGQSRYSHTPCPRSQSLPDDCLELGVGDIIHLRRSPSTINSQMPPASTLQWFSTSSREKTGNRSPSAIFGNALTFCDRGVGLIGEGLAATSMCKVSDFSDESGALLMVW